MISASEGNEKLILSSIEPIAPDCIRKQDLLRKASQTSCDYRICRKFISQYVGPIIRKTLKPMYL